MAMPNDYVTTRVVFRSPQKAYAIIVCYHILPDSPVPPFAFADNFALEFADAIQAECQAVLTTDCLLEAVQSTLTTSGSAFTGIQPVGANGLVVSDELPSYAAAVIQKRTSVPGRPGRGRWFMPFVPETLTNEGVLSNTGVTAYATLGAKLASGIIVDGINCTAAHHSQFIDSLVPIEQTLASNVLATQRRRRLRQSY